MAAQSVRTPTLLLLAPLVQPMTDGWSPLCNFTFFEPDDAEAISADKPALHRGELEIGPAEVLR